MNQLKNHNESQLKKGGALWIATGILLLTLLFSVALFSEYIALVVALSTLLIIVLGALVLENKKNLKKRATLYGLNSFITVLLVLGILGVLNFLGSRYPLKWDLTKNKVHTLSDQTVKLVKGMKQSVKTTLFSKLQQKEQLRPLLENYKALNPQFEIEYIDPDREPARAKQAGIKKYGTLKLTVGTRENQVEDATEEKITNALMKLFKEKSPTLCALLGHGEKNFSSGDAEGYEAVRKALNEQSYEVIDLNTLQGAKIPETCDALAIIGPTKAFFEPEMQALSEYLSNGGRALIALDLNLKGTEYVPELLPLLQQWYIRPIQAMVVDPLSRMLGVDASVSILASFSKESPITKNFQGNCAFPLARPLEIIPNAPATLHVEWLGQTTPKSWAVSDMKSLEKGEVLFTPGKDKAGPIITAITAEGKLKDSKAAKNTRLVVFGSSYFASNQFSRFAGNLDFFLNSVSWIMEDESLISIRTKEDGPGKIELSQKAGTFIFLLTVVTLPLLISISGLWIWIVRRRM